jgi:hypothetical protein
MVSAAQCEQLLVEPVSTMRPLWSTWMRSTSWIVESRCATTIAVRPSSSAWMPRWTSGLGLGSTLLVASSSTSTSPPCASARANEQQLALAAERSLPRSRSVVS